LEPSDLGRAGGSARREYERRRARDEQRTREWWGPLGGIAVRLTPERASTASWYRGALGEERLGAMLDGPASGRLAALHDRGVPGSRANIDHIVVAPGGVWVVDAKRYKNRRPHLRTEGGLIRPRVEKLYVGSRSCTRLVDGVLGQVGVVRSIVGHVPMRGALCFLEAEWPLFGGAFATRGVQVLWPKRLVKVLREAEGGVDVAAVAALLAGRLRRA